VTDDPLEILLSCVKNGRNDVKWFQMKEILAFLIGRTAVLVFSWLPFNVLYHISGLVYFVVYHLFRIRRAVVYSNMRTAFPDRQEAAISTLSRLFYRHFFEVHAEFFKGLTMTEPALARRFQLINPDMIGHLLSMGKGAIVVTGHYANFEWGKVLFPKLQEPVTVFHSPFTNARAFKYYARTQRRFGMSLIPVSRLVRTFYAQRGNPVWYFIAADQRPLAGSVTVRETFLKRETEFYFGYEEIARKFNIPVIFLEIQRVKRGFYTVNAIMLAAEPFNTKRGEITRSFIKTLEKVILRSPEDWWMWKRAWERGLQSGH